MTSFGGLFIAMSLTRPRGAGFARLMAAFADFGAESDAGGRPLDKTAIGIHGTGVGFAGAPGTAGPLGLATSVTASRKSVVSARVSVRGIGGCLDISDGETRDDE